MDLLAVERSAGEDAVLVRVKGDVDSTTVGELADHLKAALELAATHPARLVVVDLTPVAFFGSAGLNAVLDCHEQGMATGTWVRIVADRGPALEAIEVTELDRVLDIYPTLPGALHGGKPD
jgi:anti-sigma B factor antagonist